MTAKITVSTDTARAVARANIDVEKVLRDALANASPPPAPVAEGWTRQGVTLPNGTYLRAWHNGRAYWAEIRGGRIVWRDEEFDAPSQAALRIAGRPMNGWEFWEAHIRGTKGWTTLKDLRAEARERRVS